MGVILRSCRARGASRGSTRTHWCVRLGRHRGGRLADAVDVLRGQGADAPGVVIAGGQTGQQQSPREELQGEHRRRAPEGGPPVCVRVGTRACEDRKRCPHRQQDGGNLDQLGTVAAGQGDGQVVGGPGRERGTCAAVGPPEGDPAGAGRVTGHENGAATGQFGDL